MTKLTLFDSISGEAYARCDNPRKALDTAFRFALEKNLLCFTLDRTGSGVRVLVGKTEVAATRLFEPNSRYVDPAERRARLEEKLLQREAEKAIIKELRARDAPRWAPFGRPSSDGWYRTFQILESPAYSGAGQLLLAALDAEERPLAVWGIDKIQEELMRQAGRTPVPLRVPALRAMLAKLGEVPLGTAYLVAGMATPGSKFTAAGLQAVLRRSDIEAICAGKSRPPGKVLTSSQERSPAEIEHARAKYASGQAARSEATARALAEMAAKQDAARDPKERVARKAPAKKRPK